MFSFEGVPAGGGTVVLYSREVAAENDVLLSDREFGGDAIGVYSVPVATEKSGVGRVGWRRLGW